MSVRVIYDPGCDRTFSSLYHGQFQQWMNQNHRFAGQNGTVFDFDEAYVLNGLHRTTSTYDPDPVPHVTVRLSNSSLRNQRMWYTLHWRVGGGSVFLPRPDNEVSHTRNVEKRKEKRQRKQGRGNGSAGSHATGPAVPSRGPVPASPHRSAPAHPHGSVPSLGYAPATSHGSALIPPRGTAPVPARESVASRGYVPATSRGPVPAPPRGVAPTSHYASASSRGPINSPPRGYVPPYGPAPPVKLTGHGGGPK